MASSHGVTTTNRKLDCFRRCRTWASRRNSAQTAQCKAIIILLALFSLGVKNIKLGPKPPQFLNEEITNFLVDQFQRSYTTTADDDLNELLAVGGSVSPQLRREMEASSGWESVRTFPKISPAASAPTDDTNARRMINRNSGRMFVVLQMKEQRCRSDRPTFGDNRHGDCSSRMTRQRTPFLPTATYPLYTVTRCFASFGCRIVTTGQSACRITDSATLPIKKWLNPDLP